MLLRGTVADVEELEEIHESGGPGEVAVARRPLDAFIASHEPVGPLVVREGEKRADVAEISLYGLAHLFQSSAVGRAGGPLLDVREIGEAKEGLLELSDLETDRGQPFEGRVGGGEEAGDVLLPGLIAQEGVGVLVEIDEGDVDPRLDGTFPQEARAEGVDGADEAAPGPGAGGAEALALFSLGFPRLLLEGGGEAAPQFGGGLAGEGNGGEGVDAAPSRGDEGRHAADEARRLSGPGGGLDEQGGVEVLEDAVPRLLVGGDDGADHGFPSFPAAYFFRLSSRRRRSGSRSGSPPRTLPREPAARLRMSPQRWE